MAGKGLFFLFYFYLSAFKNINYLRMEVLVLSLYLQVLEGEIAKTIDFILFFGVKEGDAFAIAVAHNDMVGIGEWRVLSSLEVVELLPRGYEEEIPYRTCDILDGDVFVALRRVWAHF